MDSLPVSDVIDVRRLALETAERERWERANRGVDVREPAIRSPLEAVVQQCLLYLRSRIRVPDEPGRKAPFNCSTAERLDQLNRDGWRQRSTKHTRMSDLEVPIGRVHHLA